ncbi:MAG TPA: hypothetical protein VK760_12855 [Candidatus Acidoferrales bacterium]|jgi:hypothetical protein|nr:hypothetical protein [Candidatus Acidoferrales bacterium]
MKPKAILPNWPFAFRVAMQVGGAAVAAALILATIVSAIAIVEREMHGSHSLLALPLELGLALGEFALLAPVIGFFVLLIQWPTHGYSYVYITTSAKKIWIQLCGATPFIASGVASDRSAVAASVLRDLRAGARAVVKEADATGRCVEAYTHLGNRQTIGEFMENLGFVEQPRTLVARIESAAQRWVSSLSRAAVARYTGDPGGGDYSRWIYTPH